jgi:transposase
LSKIGRGSGKKAWRKHAVIVFVDETGFSFRCRPGTTWAPKGRTPVLRRISKRRVLSTAVALTLSGRIYKRHFNHAVHGADFVVFLRHLRRWLPGPLLVIWDRLQVHRSTEVKVYLNQHPEIMVERLPSYAPDLNPEEECHGNVKEHLLNATPEDTAQIRKQVNRGFARLRHRPDLILGFFRHAGLRVKRLT